MQQLSPRIIIAIVVVLILIIAGAGYMYWRKTQSSQEEGYSSNKEYSWERRAYEGYFGGNREQWAKVEQGASAGLSRHIGPDDLHYKVLHRM